TTVANSTAFYNSSSLSKQTTLRPPVGGTSTAGLAKEYIYLGSRVIAIENPQPKTFKVTGHVFASGSPRNLAQLKLTGSSADYRVRTNASGYYQILNLLVGQDFLLEINDPDYTYAQTQRFISGTAGDQVVDFSGVSGAQYTISGQISGWISS